MKKFTCILALSLFALLTSVGIALASTYTFIMPPGLNLNHGSAYSWAVPIGTSLEGKNIIGARLEIKGLTNDYFGSHFYTHLMDYAPTGSGSGAGFKGSTPEGGTVYWYDDDDYDNSYWDDDDDFEVKLGEEWFWQGRTADITYDFAAIFPNGGTESALEFLPEYSDSETLGIGFDPDCHFTYHSVKLIVETGTTVIPEPATMLLLGTGLLGLTGIRKKLRRS